MSNPKSLADARAFTTALINNGKTMQVYQDGAVIATIPSYSRAAQLLAVIEAVEKRRKLNASQIEPTTTAKTDD
jgi:hypothetical protein